MSRFDGEYARMVSHLWKNPEYDGEELIRKVESGEIFI